MDKPPEQGAKIIDLFSKRERPPKRLGAMGAKVVELYLYAAVEAMKRQTFHQTTFKTRKL